MESECSCSHNRPERAWYTFIKNPLDPRLLQVWAATHLSGLGKRVYGSSVEAIFALSGLLISDAVCVCGRRRGLCGADVIANA